MAGERSQAIGPESSLRLRAFRPVFIPVPDHECTLKAVALKPSIGSIRVREADAQRPPTRHPGEEHAPAPRCAGAEPGGAGARQRNEPDLPQRGRAGGAKRLYRQHRPHREGAPRRAVAAA